jgi:hypothetical protein
MRGQIPILDEILKALQQLPVFQPSLWQIAWHCDQVIGMVLNWVDEKEDAEHHRWRGRREFVSVRRQWRRKDVANASIQEATRFLSARYVLQKATISILSASLFCQHHCSFQGDLDVSLELRHLRRRNSVVFYYSSISRFENDQVGWVEVVTEHVFGA